MELEPYATHVITAQDLKVYEVLFYMRLKQTVRAEQLLRQVSTYPLPANMAGNGLLKLAWAELFLGQQHYEEVEAILTQIGTTRFYGYSFNVLPYTNLLLALAYWGQHKVAQAQHEVIWAIRMAKPEGIIRPFLNCSDHIIPLLTNVLHLKNMSGPYRQFIHQLIDQIRATFPNVSIPSVEKVVGFAAANLSPREREILQLLDEGLDNKALASRLVVADSTVRTHLRNIYRKLQVNSRIQAVKRAREIGIH